MIEFLVAWGPMLLLIAVWIYFMKKGGALGYKQHVQDMNDLAGAQLVEMKQTNALLTRIEAALREKG